jgi:hypothetical protein
MKSLPFAHFQPDTYTPIIRLPSLPTCGAPSSRLQFNRGRKDDPLGVRWDKAIHYREAGVKGGRDSEERGGGERDKLSVFVKEEFGEGGFESVVRWGQEEDCGNSVGVSEDDVIHCSLEGREEATF